MIKIQNNTSGNLFYDINASETEITLRPTHGSYFPTIDTTDDYYYITLSQGIRRKKVEIMKVIGRTGDVLTVERGQDGTTGESFPVDTIVEMRLNKATLDEYISYSGGSGNPLNSVDFVGDDLVFTLLDGTTITVTDMVGKINDDQTSTEVLNSSTFAGATVTDALDAAKTDIDDHETRITQNETDISTNDTDIADHETRITQNEADISTNTSDISTNDTDISTLQADKADDTDVVHDTGDETIAGVKTFSSLPVIPTTDPTLQGHAISKEFFDNNIVTGASQTWVDDNYLALDGSNPMEGTLNMGDNFMFDCPGIRANDNTFGLRLLGADGSSVLRVFNTSVDIVQNVNIKNNGLRECRYISAENNTDGLILMGPDTDNIVVKITDTLFDVRENIKMNGKVINDIYALIAQNDTDGIRLAGENGSSVLRVFNGKVQLVQNLDMSGNNIVGCDNIMANDNSNGLRLVGAGGSSVVRVYDAVVDFMQNIQMNTNTISGASLITFDANDGYLKNDGDGLYRLRSGYNDKIQFLTEDSSGLSIAHEIRASGTNVLNNLVQCPDLGSSQGTPNVYISSSGYLFEGDTSSLRLKKDVEPIEKQYYRKLKDISKTAIFFKSLCSDDDPNHTFYGFGAEPVAKIEPRFVHWGYWSEDYETITETDEKGESISTKRLKKDAAKTPVGIQYSRIIAWVVPFVDELDDTVQTQAKTIEAQNDRIDELESRLASIERFLVV